MSSNFYDKVAKKFGGYAFGHSGIDHIAHYPSDDPEKVFKEKLVQLAGKDKEKVALDVGCGDGKFAFQIAEFFKHITGIDSSAGLLKIARQKQLEFQTKNITFAKQDANKTTFGDRSFDVAFSRRGPTPFTEIFRLLKKNGYFSYIGIGEKDCQALKEIFGRGQGFGEWHEAKLQIDISALKQACFAVIFSQDFFYDEYYDSYKSLDHFLQGVPIFEDFDSQVDKKLLEKYVKQFTAKQGIKLPRHRIVAVGRKN